MDKIRNCGCDSAASAVTPTVSNLTLLKKCLQALMASWKPPSCTEQDANKTSEVWGFFFSLSFSNIMIQVKSTH